jgi:hypothetical protein
MAPERRKGGRPPKEEQLFVEFKSLDEAPPALAERARQIKKLMEEGKW